MRDRGASWRLSLCLALALPIANVYGGYAFSTVIYPGASETMLEGINSTGQMVGTARGGIQEVAFTYVGGAFTTVAVPGANVTQGSGNNSLNQIVGPYNDGTGVRGYLYDSGSFLDTSMDYPTVVRRTAMYGINTVGTVVGHYVDARYHGVIYDGHMYTSIDYSPTSGVILEDISDSGQVVGFYWEGPGGSQEHALIYQGGVFTTLDYPLVGVTSTRAYGMNDLGQIVGSYILSDREYGFLYDNGVFTTIDYAGASSASALPYNRGLIARDINNSGVIVGEYVDPVTNNRLYGFIATPESPQVPVPGALLLGAIGVSLVGRMRRHRRS